MVFNSLVRNFSLFSAVIAIMLLLTVGCDDSTSNPQPAYEKITFSFISHNFGDVTVGKDAEVTLTITNSTFSALKITKIDDDYIDVAVFTTDFNNLIAVTVQPEASHSVKIKFSPEAAESYSAKLTVQTDNENFASTDINLTGTGVGAVRTTWDNFVPI